MDKPNKELMIFQILGASRWSQEALENMSYEKVEEIYKDIIEKRGD